MFDLCCRRKWQRATMHARVLSCDDQSENVRSVSVTSKGPRLQPTHPSCTHVVMKRVSCGKHRVKASLRPSADGLKFFKVQQVICRRHSPCQHLHSRLRNSIISRYEAQSDISNMPTFSDLPAEVREHIYGWLVVRTDVTYTDGHMLPSTILWSHTSRHLPLAADLQGSSRLVSHNSTSGSRPSNMAVYIASAYSCPIISSQHTVIWRSTSPLLDAPDREVMAHGLTLSRVESGNAWSTYRV